MVISKDGNSYGWYCDLEFYAFKNHNSDLQTVIKKTLHTIDHLFSHPVSNNRIHIKHRAILFHW